MKTLLTFLALALWAAAPMNAAILYQASNVTWTGGGSPPGVNLSAPMNKTDTYYIQYTVELTSSVPAYTGGDGNNKNHSYPNVALANANEGGGAFLFYLGSGYNSDYLLSTGFTTSTWQTNQFTASNGAGTRTSTGMVAKYSTPEYGVVKYQVSMTLNMGAGTYSYTVNQLNGAGAVTATATLNNLALDTSGNYWRNNASFSTLTFASSTTQMTKKFDSIIVSTTPIPEPGTFVLVGAGAVGLWLSRRRRKA